MYKRQGVLSRLKISNEFSETLTLLSYLGIMYKKNEVIKDILNWFEYGIEFLNYGNPIQELRMAIANSEDVKSVSYTHLKEPVKRCLTHFLRNIKKTLSEGLLWELFQEERM